MTQRTKASKFSYERKPHFEPSEVDDYIDSMDSEIDEDEKSIKEKALKEENVQKHIEGKEIVKIIAIKGKIVNIVVK